MNRYAALKIAVEAHAGQRDKCGRDYILHPLAVAGALEGPAALDGPDGDYEAAVVVALLHDVIEDTNHELDAAKFDRDEWEAIYLLTRRPEQTYAEYIGEISEHRIASLVKLADLWHNLQPERQACLPEKERKSLEARYLKARQTIWDALGYEWWPEPLDSPQKAAESV